MHGKKLMITGLCLALAAVLLASGTLAWLGKTQRAEGIYTVLSDFEVQGSLTFQNGKPYTGTEILVPVSFDPGSPDYIGHMKYVVRYSGASPAYLRVRILEQWTDVSTNEVLPVSFLDYYISGVAVQTSVAESTIPAAGPNKNGALAETGRWIDHRSTDYCYYYSVPVQPKNLAFSDTSAITDGAVELKLIDQTDSKADNAKMLEGLDPATIQCSLAIEVEAVQPNRIREFWGIEALPKIE